MIPVSTLYDEYIDRPTLSEQKKPICVYSSYLHMWVGTITAIVTFQKNDVLKASISPTRYRKFTINLFALKKTSTIILLHFKLFEF